MRGAKLMQSAAKFTHQSQILFAVPGSIWKTHEQNSLINKSYIYSVSTRNVLSSARHKKERSGKKLARVTILSTELGLKKAAAQNRETNKIWLQSRSLASKIGFESNKTGLKFNLRLCPPRPKKLWKPDFSRFD